MGAPHKHRDVIIAWANGEEIEFNTEKTKWDTWPEEIHPPFYKDNIEWRIKPKIVKREGWVNIYKHANSDDTWVSDIHHTKQSADSASRVVKSKRVDCARIEWFEEEV